MIGLVMVGGSYFVSNNSESKETNSQLITTTSKPARQFIAVTDEDRDGLPDWQNSLSLNTVNLDEQEGNTRTSALAVKLATLTATSENNSDTILASVGSELAQESFDTQFTRDDILVIEDNTLSSLRSYGNKIASIALDNAPPIGTEDELTLLNRALVRNDPNVLDELSPTITSYERMVEAMLVTNVPSSMVREHLALLNVYQAILNDIKAFQGVFTDALPSMIRFRRYQADAEALYLALNFLYLQLHDRGIVWGPTDRTSQFIIIE